MKRIFSVFALALVMGLGSSCEDAIDIVQDGELNDEATFQSVEDMRQYLNGAVYSSLGGTNEIGFTSIFTDETAIGVSSGGQDTELHRFVLNTTDAYTSAIWLQHYTTINRANRLLRGAEMIVPDPDSDPDGTGFSDVDRYNNIIAQTRAIRAYAYLQLESYFSTDMSDDSALGVMLIDRVPAIDEVLPRSTNAEVFALMESDLAFASANIGDPIDVFGPAWASIATAPYKYVSSNMINAMYARFYAYRKNYPLAQQYAQAVVDNANVVLSNSVNPTANLTAFYGLTPPAAQVYRRMWADLSQGEIIFSLARPSTGAWGNIGETWYFNSTDATGGAYHEVGRNLNAELMESPTDIRQYSFVQRPITQDINGRDILPIDKYPGKASQPLRNDIKIFRLSEMYFILAEAAVAQGDLAGAAGYIKLIRDARDWADAQPLPVYGSSSEAWGDIVDERRKELCFEGFRYLDIKRLGVLAGRSIDRSVDDDVVPNVPLTIPNTDYRFTLPVPQDELGANPTIQQNPGY
ncbi:MAG: RagB/SusD family nutrient uptake outer membrane protein [Chitinophagaceae bacterium]|nr:MAG: RagB/SusD family nutrient uptake outer membrane protein [Chitinophagaceae bacterium]